MPNPLVYGASQQHILKLPPSFSELQRDWPQVAAAALAGSQFRLLRNLGKVTTRQHASCGDTDPEQRASALLNELLNVCGSWQGGTTTRWQEPVGGWHKAFERLIGRTLCNFKAFKDEDRDHYIVRFASAPDVHPQPPLQHHSHAYNAHLLPAQGVV